MQVIGILEQLAHLRIEERLREAKREERLRLARGSSDVVTAAETTTRTTRLGAALRTLALRLGRWAPVADGAG